MLRITTRKDSCVSGGIVERLKSKVISRKSKVVRQLAKMTFWVAKTSFGVAKTSFGVAKTGFDGAKTTFVGAKLLSLGAKTTFVGAKTGLVVGFGLWVFFLRGNDFRFLNSFNFLFRFEIPKTISCRVTGCSYIIFIGIRKTVR